MARKCFDTEYFQKALAEYYGCPKLAVEDFSIAVVTPSGANYCSIIHRVSLQFSRSPGCPLESGKYIIKDLLPAASALGSKEQLMFEEILPVMASVLEKASPEDLGEHKLSADCFLVDVGPGKEIYILEDLGALGYTALDRLIGLDFEEAKVCLRKLAQFHGASMVLCQEQPDLVAKLPPSHYINGLSDPFTKGLMQDGTEFVAELFDSELPEISKKMKAQFPEAYSRRMQRVVDPKESGLNTIIHGDAWLNNILFDRENQRAAIIDFQGCFLGSPAIDLYFFFYTSLQMQVLWQHQDELLVYYFHNLRETIKLCGFKGPMPTFQQLKDEMQRCLFYAYYSVVCELPLCRAKPEITAACDLSTFQDKELMIVKRRQMFDNDLVRQTVRQSLVYFDQQGILESP
ncbi:hypothetical protein KR018_007158 [Drosophila ironensis]|nr:hypothetical protein KR018_007158 [Drosophila ironensis]